MLRLFSYSFQIHLKVHNLRVSNRSWLKICCNVCCSWPTGPVSIRRNVQSGHVCMPGSALACLQGPPPHPTHLFSLGSAPSCLICHRLYLEGGTNTFLPGYELQPTDRAASLLLSDWSWVHYGQQLKLQATTINRVQLALKSLIWQQILKPVSAVPWELPE